MTLRNLSLAAIVVGLILETYRLGSEFSLGTLIAAVGIFVFVYDFFSRRQGPKF
ncbi:MAG TPA: hypothetical protein VGC50_09330 [Gammaproteobacteria bacterium]